MNYFDMTGRSAVVTGGYGHLGHAMAIGLAQYGATVYVFGRDEEKFNSRFSQQAENVKFIECDIMSTESISKGFETVDKEHGSLDVVIANAAYARGRQPAEITDDDWGYSIDGVLNSVYRCIREAIPYFRSQKGGKVLTISSMYGVVTPDFRLYDKNPDFLNPPHYGAAKAAVIHLTRYFAQYLAAENIQVNAISPGPFPKDTVQKHTHFVSELTKRTPINRIGSPEDLIGATLLLCSQASNFITGHNLIVDGGWTLT